jgi:hypothetical protein
MWLVGCVGRKQVASIEGVGFSVDMRIIIKSVLK